VSLRYSIYQIKSQFNFFSNFNNYYFFHFPDCSDRTSNIKLSKNSESSYLVPYLRKKAFCFSSFNIMFPVCSLYVCYYVFSYYVPSIPNFLNIVIKCIFSFIEVNIRLFSFILLMWYITFDYFHVLNHPYIPRMNPT
jgi:hypothetical protein